MGALAEGITREAARDTTRAAGMVRVVGVISSSQDGAISRRGVSNSSSNPVSSRAPGEQAPRLQVMDSGAIIRHQQLSLRLVPQQHHQQQQTVHKLLPTMLHGLHTTQPMLLPLGQTGTSSTVGPSTSRAGEGMDRQGMEPELDPQQAQEQERVAQLSRGHLRRKSWIPMPS